MKNFVYRFIICTSVSGIIWKFASSSPEGAGSFAYLSIGLLWAWLMSGYLVHMLPAIKRSADESVLGKWQGSYYAYHGVQVRFYLVDDTVWTACDDLAHIVVPAISERELYLMGPSYGAIPGQPVKGIREDAVIRLLTLRTNHRRADPQMLRFKRWLETQAFPNVKRRPDSAAG
jgi:hypothetical protein